MFLSGSAVKVDVRAAEPLRLSERVSLSSAVTVAEGVNANGTAGPLNLAFTTSLAPATAPNTLLQNRPNPVTDRTTIGFSLAEAGPATLTLRDAAGRLIRTYEIDAVAGMNQFELERIGRAGVISYTLTAGEFVATRKMVVVR